MSRGGRGGFGGRGGGGFGSTPWTYDPELKPDYTPTDLFPSANPPVQSELSPEERLIVARFVRFRDQMHNGPFYTVLGKRKAIENAFEEVQMYSSRYQRQKRKAPKLDARPFCTEFFPDELHATLDPTGKAGKGGTKTLTFTPLDILQVVDELADESDKEGADDGETGNDAADEEHDDEEAEDDFVDDEEGDYNAENYFEDGDEEDYGDDDGGGGGGDYY